jgi:hypothetical protein
LQLPDTEPVPAYVPAPKSLMTTGDNASATQPATSKTETSNAAANSATALTPASLSNLPPQSNALAEAIARYTGDAPPMPTALANKSNGANPRPAEEAPPLSAAQATTTPPTTTAAVDAGKAATQPDDAAKDKARADSSIVDKLKAELFGKAATPPEPVMPMAEARLMPPAQEMRVGEKQRISLVLISKEPLGNTTARLHFDPRVLAVRGISQGPWAGAAQSAPTIMQSIDPAGLISLAISPQPGAPLKSGASVILFLEIEALAAGESVISFDPNAQAVTSDGRSVKLQMTESRLTVK